MHTSKRKRGKSYVLFRNRQNRVFVGVDALISHLKGEGEDVAFLDWHNFLSERSPEVNLKPSFQNNFLMDPVLPLSQIAFHFRSCQTGWVRRGRQEKRRRSGHVRFAWNAAAA